MKYRFNDSEKKLSFGTYPEVTLAAARDKQVEARRLLIDREIDPDEHKKQTKRAAKVAAANSFEAVAQEWFAKFSPKWAESHSSKVLLRRTVLPSAESDQGSCAKCAARTAPREYKSA